MGLLQWISAHLEHSVGQKQYKGVSMKTLSQLHEVLWCACDHELQTMTVVRTTLNNMDKFRNQVQQLVCAYVCAYVCVCVCECVHKCVCSWISRNTQCSLPVSTYILLQ